MLASVLTILLGPPYGPSDSEAVRWRWLALRLIGPGSVPLAFCLTVITRTFLSVGYANAHLAFVFGVVTSLPVVLAAYRPLLAWAIAFGSFWVFTATTAPIDQYWYDRPWPWVPGALVAYLIVQFAVARRYGVGVALPTWLATVLAGTLLALDQGVRGSTGNLQLTGTLAAFALVLGLVARLRVRSRQRLEHEERVAAEERERRRLLEERTRIARELHDIVAHHMSVIALQASSAPYRLSGMAEVASPVADEFDAISRQARESLAEMRRLLAVLRNPDDPTDREPQPGVDAVERLAESTRAAGTPVRVEGVEEVPRDLSETVSLTGYRIVQEALSNVVRHAPGAPTSVRLDVSKKRLTVSVVNRSATEAPTGTGTRNSHVPPNPPPESAGLGLVGMRERVELLGGELSFEDGPDGGFEVTAALPLSPTEIGPTAAEPGEPRVPGGSSGAGES